MSHVLLRYARVEAPNNPVDYLCGVFPTILSLSTLTVNSSHAYLC